MNVFHFYSSSFAAHFTLCSSIYHQILLNVLYLHTLLLQTHPELLSTSNKSGMGGMGVPWEEHPTHRSMDYQERVSRFLSHAIGDQNPRSLSTVNSDNQGSSSPTGSSSGGRGSPANTLPILPDHTKTNSHKQAVTDTLPGQDNTHSERKPRVMEVASLPDNAQSNKKPKLSNSELLRLKRSEHKAKAPVPNQSDNKKLSEYSDVNEMKNKLNEANSKRDTNVKVNEEKCEIKSEGPNTKTDKHEHRISEEKQKSKTNELNTKCNKHEENATQNKEVIKSESKTKDSQIEIISDMSQSNENKLKNEQSLEKVANNKSYSDKEILPKNIKEDIHSKNSDSKDLKDKTTSPPKNSTSDNTTKPEELQKIKNSKNSTTKTDRKNKTTKDMDENNKKETRNQGKPTEVKEELKIINENTGKVTTTPTTTTIEQLGLLTDIKPPCEFQDT